MKKFKKILALVLGIMLMLSAVACSTGNGGSTDDMETYLQKQEQAYNKAKESSKTTPSAVYKVGLRGLGSDVLPIGTFLGPMDGYYGNGYKLPSQINAKSFQQMKDCHVNYIMDPRNALDGVNGETLLNYADEYQIAYIISHRGLLNLESTAENAVVASGEVMAETLRSTVDNHPYFAGLYGRDEPSTLLYPKIDESIKEFAKARTALNATDLTMYYNLFPPVGGNQLSYNTDSGLTYEQYLQGFLDCDPDYLMFDSYPFMEGTDRISGSWFNLLGQIASKATENEVPWWGYVQCGGHYPDVNMGHRVVNEGEMNWNVNTMLAFGAKGYGYFPGFFPTEWAWQYPGVFTEENTNDNSLINKYGTKTQSWYYAEKINKQVVACDEYLMNSAHMGVIFTGDGPQACRYTGKGIATLNSFRNLKKVSGDDSLIGCFDYKGGVALYVMNNSIVEERAEVTLEFDGEYGYKIIQRGITDYLVGKTFTLTLQAGESALVVIK